MTTVCKLTEKEYNLVTALNKALQELSNEAPGNSNLTDFFSEKDVTVSDMDAVIWDLNNDDLLQAIGQYKDGITKDAAYDSNGSGFIVVDILNHRYGAIFGYTETDGKKTYYLCESKESYNEELEEEETYFFVDNEAVSLNFCIRFDLGGR